MTTLLVDMESLPDMMSALDQIAARVVELSTSDAELALTPDDLVHNQDLPWGSTEDFADDLWERSQGTAVRCILGTLTTISKSPWQFSSVYPFSLNEIVERVDLGSEPLYVGLRELQDIEERIGAQLLHSEWSPEDGFVYYGMHPVVRDRLSILLQSELSD